MKIKIKVTKDILRRSMWCGTDKIGNDLIITNCAIALAVRDMLPDARVGVDSIYGHSPYFNIENSLDTRNFISSFGYLVDTPNQRLNLPEYEFEIELPAEVVDAIDIDDIYRSETLEVVTL